MLLAIEILHVSELIRVMSDKATLMDIESSRRVGRFAHYMVGKSAAA